MNKTSIPWCDFTWSPWTGCYGPGGKGPCSYCYARGIARHYAAKEGASYIDTTISTPDGPVYVAKAQSKPFPMGFKPTYYPGREDEPFRRKKPTRIFVNDMSDVAGDWVPDEWLDRLFAVIKKAPWHTYLLLTKNPRHLADYCLAKADLDSLGHVWFGTTVETQTKANERIPELVRIPGNLFVSCEPLLGPLDLKSWLPKLGDMVREGKLGWAIVGGESGFRARPMLAKWVRDLCDQCVCKGVPFFFKGFGEWLPTELVKPEDWLAFGCRYCLAGDGASGEVGGWYKVGARRSGHLLDLVEWHQLPPGM